jgi:exodeoxyribonuclease VII large subunit
VLNESPIKPDKIYRVSELTQLIKLELENSFPRIWVEGEVSNFHRHSSGHLYFTLKDASSQIRAVIWRSDARTVKFDFKDGLQLVCRGRINVYEPRGEYQVVVDLAEPKGKGALQLAFEQLKEKLRAEGLFDPQRKKKLPLFPQKVGVVTSPRGAAIQDILRILERRFSRLHILICPAKVQGEGAAEEIVEGIDTLGRRSDIDVIIVGRGGGSIEDLWAFNEEKVARAIFRCPIPIISAVGHEVDFTIADFVADVRASTPSAAAEMVIEKEDAILDRIANLEKGLAGSLKFSVQDLRHRVDLLADHRIFQGFRLRLRNLEQEVDELEERARESVRRRAKNIAEHKMAVALFEEKLGNSLKGALRDLLARWEKFSVQLHNLSPLNILEKGYALVWKEGGLHPVQSIEEVRKDQELTVSFHRGEFRCEVRDVDRRRRIESRVLKEKP